MAKKKFINTVTIEGYLYSHTLERKETGPKSKNPGVTYIAGTLNIATDDEMLNVVPVYFTYVTENGKNGPNATYTILDNIISGKLKVYMDDSGGDNTPTKIKVNSSIGLNEWYDRKNNDQLVSNKRNEGGFVSVISAFPKDGPHASFDEDMVINSFVRKEADEEKGIPERGILKGCIFNFRGDMLPVEFSVLMPRAIDYFEAKEISPKNPIFTRVSGQEISKTVVKSVTEEGAFGNKVIETTNTQRDFVVDWTAQEAYAWDDEETLLASELSEKITAREIYLAELKQRRDEALAAKANAAAPGAFDF